MSESLFKQVHKGNERYTVAPIGVFFVHGEKAFHNHHRYCNSMHESLLHAWDLLQIGVIWQQNVCEYESLSCVRVLHSAVTKKLDIGTSTPIYININNSRRLSKHHMLVSLIYLLKQVHRFILPLVIHTDDQNTLYACVLDLPSPGIPRFGYVSSSYFPKQFLPFFVIPTGFRRLQ